MKRGIMIGIGLAIAWLIIPAVSKADVEVKLSASVRDATVEVIRTAERIEEGKAVKFTCRVVAIYAKTGRAVFDDKKDADIEFNASKRFNFNFKNALQGTGKYYILAIVKNTKSGAEYFKIVEVTSS